MQISLLIIINKKGQFLLQDRRGISKVGEDWGFFGGKLDFGETSEECLKRELKEELNLESFDYKKIFEGDINLKGKLVNYNCFLHITERNEVSNFQVLEGDGAEFFNIEEMKKLKFPVSWDTQIEFIDAGLKEFGKVCKLF